MKKFKEGDVLTLEGSKDRTLYVLIKGSIGVFKGNIQITKFTEKGTIVGELSLILRQPRSATIKALEDTSVLEIKADIEELMRKYPDILKKIIHTMATRLSDITDDYWKLAEKVSVTKAMRDK